MGIRNHPEYERGYAEGYQSGYNFALEPQIDAAKKSAQPAVTITAPAEVVNAARSSLAQKVLEITQRQIADYASIGRNLSAVGAAKYEEAKRVDTDLRDLFQREGIELKP